MFQVFAGLIINLKTLPEWVEFLKYISLVYYGVSVSKLTSSLLFQPSKFMKALVT